MLVMEIYLNVHLHQQQGGPQLLLPDLPNIQCGDRSLCICPFPAPFWSHAL